MTKAGSPSSLKWIRNVHKRLVGHMENQSTDLMTPKIHSNKAGETYFSVARDQVASAAPALLLPSCLLPFGHVIADHIPSTNTPILVYRDALSGTVHAYRNQCRHRGSALIFPSKSCTPQRLRKGSSGLTCPYHAWTYDIRNGELKAVPGEKAGFPCLSKASMGLEPLACTETAGGIWVGGAGRAGEEDLTDHAWWSLNEIDAELNDLWLPPPPLSSAPNNNAQFTTTDSDSSRLVGFREWTLDANWQLLVETFLETYHVPYLHRDTLGLVTQHNNVVVADRLDQHSVRHTVALTNFDVNRSLAPPSSDDDDDDDDCTRDDNNQVTLQDPFFSQTTTTYFLFPNVAVSLFKRFAIFLSILPYTNHNNTGETKARSHSNTAAASCKSRVRAWGVSHAAVAEGEDLTTQQRDFASVVKGIEEDWECTEHIQRGLHPDTVLTHGRFEGNNVEFLANVGKIAAFLQSDDRRNDGTTTQF